MCIRDRNGIDFKILSHFLTTLNTLMVISLPLFFLLYQANSTIPPPTNQIIDTPLAVSQHYGSSVTHTVMVSERHTLKGLLNFSFNHGIDLLHHELVVLFSIIPLLGPTTLNLLFIINNVYISLQILGALQSLNYYTISNRYSLLVL